MKSLLKKEWPLLLLVLVPIFIAIYVYPYMPDRVPVHWNLQGQVDRYESKFFGTFFLPGFNLFLYILLLLTPYIDPKKSNYQKFQGSFNLVRFVFHTFMTLIFILTILVSLNYSIDISFWVYIGVCLLFIITGNVLSRVRHNYFIGFRYPWTLANEEVWRKTHLIGSKLMVAGGVIGLFGILFSNHTIRFGFLMFAIFTPTIFTTIYSLVYYKKLNKGGN